MARRYDTDGYAIILKQIFNSFGGPCEIACIERKTEYYMVAQKYEFISSVERDISHKKI